MTGRRGFGQACREYSDARQTNRQTPRQIRQPFRRINHASRYDFMKGLQRTKLPWSRGFAEPLTTPNRSVNRKKVATRDRQRENADLRSRAELIIIGAILVVNWSLAERGHRRAILFGKRSLAAMAGARPWLCANWSGPGWSFGAVHRRRMAGLHPLALCFRSWLRRRA